MSSAPSSPQDGGEVARPPAPHFDAAPGRTDRSLLENVLRQTLDETDAGSPLDDEDRAALLDVARRHGDRPLSLEPVAVELVQAVLATHFRGLSSVAAFWRTVSAQVAAVLLDDPVARPRLERLWNHLVRTTS